MKVKQQKLQSLIQKSSAVFRVDNLILVKMSSHERVCLPRAMAQRDAAFSRGFSGSHRASTSPQ